MSMTMINGKMITTDNGASICTINNQCFINGVEVPDEDGEYNIKGARVTVKNAGSGSFSFGGFSFNNNVFSDVQINCSGSDNIQRDGDDYIMSGIGNEMEKNIYVKGNISISGINNRVKFGKRREGYEDLEVKGNLVVSGMNMIVGNIVQFDGKIINSGINNKIIE